MTIPDLARALRFEQLSRGQHSDQRHGFERVSPTPLLKVQTNILQRRNKISPSSKISTNRKNKLSPSETHSFTGKQQRTRPLDSRPTRTHPSPDKERRRYRRAAANWEDRARAQGSPPAEYSTEAPANGRARDVGAPLCEDGRLEAPRKILPRTIV